MKKQSCNDSGLYSGHRDSELIGAFANPVKSQEENGRSMFPFSSTGRTDQLLLSKQSGTDAQLIFKSPVPRYRLCGMLAAFRR
jgi:hypothetical protein